MELFALDWSDTLDILIKIAAAFALTLPVALEREHSTRIMGLRTFPLVAIASCGYVLIGMSIAGENEDALARSLQGLMGGMGFIGGGAILKEGATVRGTATAASIWSTGAIGAASALGRLEIALLISVISFLTLRLLTPLARDAGRSEKQVEADQEE